MPAAGTGTARGRLVPQRVCGADASAAGVVAFRGIWLANGVFGAAAQPNPENARLTRLPAATRLVMRLDVWAVRLTGGSFFMWLFARRTGLARDADLSSRKARALVLVTRGRRSGRNRSVVLPCFTFDGKTFVVGSRGGAPQDPDWVGNLLKTPAATIYLERRPRKVCARIASAAERAHLWPQLIAVAPTYAGYQARIERQIPLVILE